MPTSYYKLTVEYDGLFYHGWQKQPNRPTLQGTIETALTALTGETIPVVSSGRTDAGVHAVAQVVTFQSDRVFEPYRLVRGLNALLPHDIAVKTVEKVSASFHPRYNAKRKTYSYFIYNGNTRSPHRRQTAWHVPMPLDIRKMRQAAKRLTGDHDFTSLTAAENDANDCRVDLKTIRILKVGEEIRITLVASRFLRYMVRNIVGLLVEVGRGRRSVKEIAGILEGKDRRLAGPTAPPHGLFLVDVVYEEKRSTGMAG